MSLSKEESNFLRFYFLNLKIASKAVRAYFDSVHPPSGIANELANCSGTLNGLRFITNSQLKILYPSPACYVKSEHFDSTLIVCLLRNMTPRERAPMTGWDKLPLPGDASKGADLARVKWYRNMLAHHGDGKLSQTDFSQYWADLEGAILRLGGPSLLKESQSAQHIVLDTSLIDMLKALRACGKDVHNLQMSQKDNTSMIKNLETKLEKQSAVKEEHENKIKQLQNSLQKGKTEVQNLAIKLLYTNRSITKCKENIEVCTKKIKKNEVSIKNLQDQSDNKQNQIDKLEVKYEQHDKILKEHGEHLAKHDEHMVKDNKRKRELEEQMVKHNKRIKETDEQIASCVKEIDDIKNKQHDTNDSSNERKRKRLEDDTKALIDEDLREGTFVTTTAVTDGLLLMKKNGVLMITGHAGTGKSRISRHILYLFGTENTSYKCIKLNKLQEWEDIVRREDVVVLLDDIFGETNCIYNREKDIPILDKIHAYVRKGNIKVMITIRDTVQRQCQEVFDNHRLFKFECVDLSSEKYKLSGIEKKDILTIYMKKVRQSELVQFKGFINQNGIEILESGEISKITNENPVKGFPLVVYQFVHNDKYFQLRSTFFDRPTEAILNEIHEIRRQGEINQKFMIQYGVMVYTAINENGIDPDDNQNVTEVSKIFDAVYGETIRMKKCHISDAVKELKGSYLVKNPNQRSYKFHHPTLQESVILSFAQIDEENMNKIIPLLSWTFFIKIVKSNAYEEKEGEVVLRIPHNSYKLLADRLADIYMEKFSLSLHNPRIYNFLVVLSDTEIFQQEDFVLLTYVVDAVASLCMKSKNLCLANLLVILANKERLYKMFQFVLQMLNQIIKTDHNYFNGFLKTALVKSVYKISIMKDVRSVNRFKALLDIVEENKIPILFDQHAPVYLTKTPVYLTKIMYTISEPVNLPTSKETNGNYTLCVFLNLCISNAYQQCNIPLLEYLLSIYQKTPFDVNLFLKMFYGMPWHVLSSVSHKPLKWMIEKFEDQEIIDIDSLLETACHLQLLGTLEYLAPRSKTFNAISCLKIFACSSYNWNKDMFNYLFSKIDITSTEQTSIVMFFLRNKDRDVPDYVFDAFFPVCLNNKEILMLVCKQARFHVAKEIMEKSHNVDIQSVFSACIDAHVAKPKYDDWNKLHFKIVKYIIEKFGYEQFDLKAACRLAYQYENFKLIQWFVQNIDLSLLNVDYIRNSLLEKSGLQILDYTMNKAELTYLEKRKVLKTVIKLYTTECSSKILQIVNTVWDNTDEKEELKMEEILIAAFKGNCFNLLLWIYENCNSYISTDARTLFMLACEDDKVEVAKCVFEAFGTKSWDIDGVKLFISACNKMIGCNMYHVNGVGIANWVLNIFPIKPVDLKSELMRLLSINTTVDGFMLIDKPDCYDVQREFLHFVVSIFEKCFNCLSSKDLQILMKKSINEYLYILLRLFLENDSWCWFDKQNIINKACADADFDQIKLLSENFSSLDMHNAMVCACMSTSGYPHGRLSCLDYLWNKTNHESIDKGKIVSTIHAMCRQKYVSDDVITWIFQNLSLNQIQINDVLRVCCKQRNTYHVKYICHEIDNEQLDINEAFRHACTNPSSRCQSEVSDLFLEVFLFERLRDKTNSLSVILNELLLNNSFDLILYFLTEGYIMNIDMKHLMNRACRFGHVGLVRWILANVQHTQLDIKSAFHNACIYIITLTCHADDCDDAYTYYMMCVALIWHCIQDINMLDIDTVLKTITEASSNMPSTRRLMNWIKYIQNINQRRMCKSEISLLNT